MLLALMVFGQKTTINQTVYIETQGGSSKPEHDMCGTCKTYQV